MAMKLAHHTSVYCGKKAKRDIEEVIRLFSKLGFEGIEINAEDNHGRGRENRYAGLYTTDDEINRIKELCLKYNLKVTAIAAHFSFISLDEKQRQTYIDEYKRCIDQAQILGTDIVHGFSGDPENPIVKDEDEAWRIFKKGCVEVLDYAKGKGVRFAIEPVINHLVHGLKSVRKMFEIIDREDFYLNCDFVHIYLSGSKDDPITLIREYGHKIINVHMKDGFEPGYFNWEEYKRTLVPKWSNVNLPFQGEMDFKTIIHELKKVGYNGYLSCEYVSGLGYLPEYRWFIDCAAEHFIRRMREILS